MKRRTFIKLGAAGTATLFLPLSFLQACQRKMASAALDSDFLNPPQSAKPYTWWHWMNGNITSDGITRDLEFLQKAGIGGFQIFQVGTGIPKGPVAFGGSEWAQLLQHAAREAKRLDLEYDMMNAGGWSSSGGPWITPELSMQQLTWSEMHVKGGKTVNVKLPQPYTKLKFYRDAFVLAFPSLEGETSSMNDLLRNVTSSNGKVNANLLTDNDFTKAIEVKGSAVDQPVYLQLEFKEPYRAQSITTYAAALRSSGSGRSPRFKMKLESSNDGRHFRDVCDIDIPNWRNNSIEVPGTANFSPVKAKYFRLSAPGACRFMQLRLSGASRIVDWPLKANFIDRGAIVAGAQLPATGSVTSGSVIDPDKVVDITQHMDKEGQLNWQAPEGNWTILRMGHTAVGIQNHPSPDGGGGLECDKYSEKAYDFHFNKFFGKLLPFLESLGKNGKSGSVIDSYEVGMQTWTADYPQQFKTYRGYDIKNYLPALTGRVVGSGDVSDRFLWDIRRTDADLMDDKYYGRFAELCNKHNMKAYSETYSGGPFDEIQAGSRMDVPMGEFWAGLGQTNGVYYSIKMASSIGHVYGKPVVAAESYTGVPWETKWQQYPYALKGEGDWMYTQGLNKYIFHVYAMQPHPTVKPGMTMGPWGWMHSRNNSWANHEHNWLAYIHRCQYLLQKGTAVADIVYYAGVEIPSNAPVLPEQLNPTPPKGYFYDVSDGKGIVDRMKPGNGRIMLPDGMSYKVIVLPESDKISLQVLQKVRDLVNGGAAVVGPKPKRTPGLENFKENDTEIGKIADEMWGDLDGKNNTMRSYGSGHVFWGMSMADVMKQLNIQPDFEFTSRSGDAPVNYIHKTIDNAEVYFIANRRRQTEDLVCTFRVKGMQPEFWDAATGKRISVSVYETSNGRTKIPVRLGPAGSVFVVFQSRSGGNGLQSVSKDGKMLITTAPYPQPAAGRYRDVSNNFSVSMWIKPDTDIIIGDLGLGGLAKPTGFVFYPPDGSKLYGKGHAAAGLIVGRNGIAVYERSNSGFNNVLPIEVPIAGWSQVTLVYNNGIPSVYLNGKLLKKGKKSGEIVHPGLHEAYQDDGANYFHGELSKLELSKDVLSESKIQELASTGRPDPENPPAAELGGGKRPALMIWENGTYSMQGSNGKKSSIKVSGITEPVEINDSWQVAFPPDLGAPDRIKLDKLISLKDHPIDGVRYFSGTAVYSRQINIPSALLASGKRLYLDLGRVEVFAQVRLNGKDLQTLWKPPFRVDITDAAKPGSNNLEVLVTNLWPNRLIGDEHLPPENEYSKGEGPRASIFGGAIKKLPDWYMEGKPKPGKRITFATWKHFSKDDPLVESGLLGPVKLRTGAIHTINL